MEKYPGPPQKPTRAVYPCPSERSTQSPGRMTRGLISRCDPESPPWRAASCGPWRKPWVKKDAEILLEPRQGRQKHDGPRANLLSPLPGLEFYSVPSQSHGLRRGPHSAAPPGAQQAAEKLPAKPIVAPASCRPLLKLKEWPAGSRRHFPEHLRTISWRGTIPAVHRAIPTY
jgi:hypothetical protein